MSALIPMITGPLGATGVTLTMTMTMLTQIMVIMFSQLRSH